MPQVAHIQTAHPKILVLPKPEPIDLNSIEWHITEQGFIALTPKGYSILSQNMAEILRYTIEADAQLTYYGEKLNAE